MDRDKSVQAESNEERLLHIQSWNATLPFPGAIAIFGDGEGLPWSSHEDLNIHGVSIIARRIAKSSTEECAHSAAGSQVRATAPQLQQSLCLAAGVPPEQHPHLKRQRKIHITAFNLPAFHMAGRAPGFLEGWFSKDFAPDGTYLASATCGIVGQCPGTETRGSLSFSRPGTHTPLPSLLPGWLWYGIPCLLLP